MHTLCQLNKVAGTLLIRGMWLPIFLLLPVAQIQADDLESLLKRLDLKDLQATMVENRLSQTIDLDEQARLRKVLAKLYVDQLEGLVEQPEKFSKVVRKLDELETKVTELKNPEIEFSRLETQFRHGEFLLSKYREDRKESALLVDISRVFGMLSERFEKLETRCEKKIESLDAESAVPGSLKSRELDREIDELSEISFRSSFYSGWSSFHVGVTKQSPKLGQPFLVKALGAFCVFLDLDAADDVENWDEDFLELSSTRNAQAFLGVALTYLALGQNSDADHCFDLLGGEATAESVRNQLAFWQIQLLLEFGRMADGFELASAYLANTDLLSALQRGQIALMLIRFAYADPRKDPDKIKLGHLGFQTLAQLRQFTLVQKLINEYSVVLPRPSFYSDWVTGKLQYEEAEKSGSESDYLKAANTLQAAVALDKDIPVSDVERCRYQLGWAYYKGANYAKAAECFELVIARMARLDPGIAATASWLQHDCYLKQSEANPEYVKRALAVLDNLVNRFPDTELSKRARLQIVKLRQTKMNAEDTVKRLKEVVASSPSDMLSKYELCLAQYQKYRQLVAKKSGHAEVASDVKKLVEELTKFGDKLTPQQNLKLVLIQLDIQIRDNVKDKARVDQLIAKAESMVSSTTNKALQAELRYRQVQVAQDRNDRDELQKHVGWLVENGDGTVYQRSVLVTRIQQIERELKNSGSSNRRKWVDEAIEVYLKLAKAAGYNSHGIATSTNAKVAVARLATLMEETGDLSGAEKNLELLVKAFPKKVSYVKQYARVLTKAKKYSQALSHWRKLAGGLKKETDDWYLAKYNLINCLAETDPEQAKPPLRQFMNLYEPPAKWKSKFAALSTKLGIE